MLCHWVRGTQQFECTRILQNTRNHTPNNTASHYGRPDTSATVLTEHSILQYIIHLELLSVLCNGSSWDSSVSIVTLRGSNSHKGEIVHTHPDHPRGPPSPILAWLLNPWGMDPYYPLNKRLVGSQTCSGWFAEKMGILHMEGIEPRILRTSSP